MKREQNKKVALTTENLQLVIGVLDRLNALLSHNATWGSLALVDQRIAEDLERKLKMRLREENCSALKVPNNDYEINEKFFKDLGLLLEKFIKNDGFGDGYAQERTQRFMETTRSLKKLVREEDHHDNQ